MSTEPKYFALVSADRSGPAYGIGLSEAEARHDASQWDFTPDSGIAVELTKAGYQAVLAGNPDAWNRTAEESAYTPGPWTAYPPGADTEFPSEDWVVLDCYGRTATVYGAGDDDEEAEANARLIAAAPTLLEALKELLALDEFDESVRGVSSRRAPAMDKARAAIAQAEGK